jgi:hypothetical protein
MPSIGKRFENAKQKTLRKIENPQNHCLPYLKLFLNHLEFQKTLKMNKLRNFITNPTVYHMHQSDERYENRDKKYSLKIQIDAEI